jgi:CubicO group peptidase (beta-lactamase class C family)
MTIRASRVPILILAALCSVGAARAQDQYSAIRADIEREIAAGRATGVAVALTQKGRIVWQEGFGWADKERGRRVTPDTPFSLASVTKPFTTTALMVLVAANEVSLDARANDYLGTAKIRAGVGNPDEVTVRALASHSAGLPGTFQIFPVGGALKQPSMDEVIRNHGVLVSPPNERFQYSNVGMGSLRTSRRARADSISEVSCARRCSSLWDSSTASSIPTCRDAPRWPSATTAKGKRCRSM